jgi:hypothetical protein
MMNQTTEFMSFFKNLLMCIKRAENENELVSIMNLSGIRTFHMPYDSRYVETDVDNKIDPVLSENRLLITFRNNPTFKIEAVLNRDAVTSITLLALDDLRQWVFVTGEQNLVLEFVEHIRNVIME